MISISLSIFLAVGKKTFEDSGDNCLIKISVLLWILSLVVSFFVLFPWRYRYVAESVKSIKEAHRRIVRVKYVLLIASLVLFVSALGILVFLFK